MNRDVYGYVRYCFQKNFPEYYLIFGEDGIKYPGRKFIETIESKINGNYSSQDIKRGLFDDEINKELNDYLNGYFTQQQRDDCKELYDHVKNLLIKRGVKKHFSNDIFDHIVKKVMARVYPQYDRNAVDIERFNQVIDSVYKDVAKKLFEQVNKKITKLIYVRDDIFNFITYNINEVELRKFIVDSIFANEDRLFLEKLNLIVIDNKNSLNHSQTAKDVYAYMKQYVSKNAKKRPDTVEYIAEYLRQNIAPKATSNYIYEAAAWINERLINKERLRAEEIVSPECEDLIRIYYSRFFMRSNSVQNSGQLERIEKKGKKRRMSDKVIALLLVASLLGVSTIFALGMDKYTSDKDAQKEVAMFDNYSYSQIDSVYDNDLELTANNVIKTYFKYSQFNNDNYKYLGFYRAFASVESKSYKSVIAETSTGSREDTYRVEIDERLFVMDNMLDSIKKSISRDSQYSSMKIELMANDCYLDFVYDRLEEMGFDKIRDDKYTEVLDAYREARREHKLLNPLKYMNSKEKKIIEEVLEKYTKYSEQYIIELGELLGEQKNTETEGLSDSTGGRSI